MAILENIATAEEMAAAIVARAHDEALSIASEAEKKSKELLASPASEAEAMASTLEKERERAFRLAQAKVEAETNDALSRDRKCAEAAESKAIAFLIKEAIGA